MGKWKTGILWALTLGLLGIGWAVDLIIALVEYLKYDKAHQNAPVTAESAVKRRSPFISAGIGFAVILFFILPMWIAVIYSASHPAEAQEDPIKEEHIELSPEPEQDSVDEAETENTEANAEATETQDAEATPEQEPEPEPEAVPDETKAAEPEAPEKPGSGKYTVAGVEYTYTDYVLGDKTGKWTKAVCYSEIPPDSAARELCETFRPETGVPLWICNLYLKTTTRILSWGTTLDISVTEYVEGEENRADILGSGTQLSQTVIDLTEAAP